MTTAFVVAGSSHHQDADCQALDNARLSAGAAAFQVDTDSTDRTPCILCTDTVRTEWEVTPQTIAELWELIGLSKYHTVVDPGTDRVTVDGLTILEHGSAARSLALFGDTVRLHPDGTYRVHPAAVPTGAA
ncbi:hypothetical protein ACFWXO_05460 [Kitasatospora sp. NPDC059088]|uniref:hypothetical protein n=1 Tax=Kitasatospora sp. NPDC059088 TaxID=3346722 RepID=UPI0036A78B78